MAALSILLTALALAAPPDAPAAPDQPEAPLHQRIDALLAEQHTGPVAPLADDAAYLRRTHLNLVGAIPSAEEARAFLADDSPDKRAKLVDRLLADARHPLHMAEVFDVMLMERRRDKHIKDAQWRAYLVESFRQNKPYNVLAREILAADGAEKPVAAAKFYLDRDDGEANLLTRDLGRIFFGRDLQCAQCHDHPNIDDYAQADYYGLYAFISPGFVFTGKDKKVVFAEKAGGDVEFKSVFSPKVSFTTTPRLFEQPAIDEPPLSGDAAYKVKPAKNVRPVPTFSRRQALAEHATGGLSQAFNRNIVNRLWKHMMGAGLVDPPDLHHAANRPVSPAVLDVLADSFVAMDFDIRAMLRELALTQAYQRSFEMPAEALAAPGTPDGMTARVNEADAQLKAAQKALLEAYGPVDDAVDAVREARQAVAAADGEIAKANEALAAATKAADEKAKPLNEAKAALVKKQEAAAAVTSAAGKAKQAVALLADDAQLAEAAKVIETKAAALTGEAAELKKKVESLQSPADEAAQALAAAEQTAASLKMKREQAEQAFAAAAKQREEAAAHRDRLLAETAAMKQRLAVTQAQAEVVRRTAEAEALRRQAAAAQQELAKQDESLEQMTAALAAAAQQIEELEKKLPTLAAAVDDSTAAMNKATAKAHAVAEAATQAQAAAKQLPEDKQLAAAAAQFRGKADELASAQQAAAEALAAARKQQEDAASALAATRTQQQNLSNSLASRKQERAVLASKLGDLRGRQPEQDALADAAFDGLTDVLAERFAVRPLSPLTPEQLAWSVMRATGVYDRQVAASRAELEKAAADAAAKATAEAKKKADGKDVEPVKPQTVTDEQVAAHAAEKLRGSVKIFVDLFAPESGQPQDDFFATVDQALFFNNGSEVRGWLAPAEGSLTDHLIKMEEPAAIAEELYLSVLTRRPTAGETADVAAYLAKRKDDKAAAVQDLAWALIASAEFRFNH